MSMYCKAALLVLLYRIERATGPNRTIDREVKEVLHQDWDYSARWTSGPVAFPYTSSLDAVAALQERVLPGLAVHLHRNTEYPDQQWACSVSRDGPWEHAQTECLARLRAIVAALIAMKENGNG